jgi:hypothetical protein
MAPQRGGAFVFGGGAPGGSIIGAMKGVIARFHTRTCSQDDRIDGVVSKVTSLLRIVRADTVKERRTDSSLHRTAGVLS